MPARNRSNSFLLFDTKPPPTIDSNSYDATITNMVGRLLPPTSQTRFRTLDKQSDGEDQANSYNMSLSPMPKQDYVSFAPGVEDRPPLDYVDTELCQDSSVLVDTQVKEDHSCHDSAAEYPRPLSVPHHDCDDTTQDLSLSPSYQKRGRFIVWTQTPQRRGRFLVWPAAESIDLSTKEVK